jgi:hypothetical protein
MAWALFVNAAHRITFSIFNLSYGQLQRYCRRYDNESDYILRWIGKWKYFWAQGANYLTHVSKNKISFIL